MIKSVLSLIKEDKQTLEIVNDLCGYRKSSRFSCTKCTDVCPDHALVWNSNAWEINNCQVCGNCVNVCPNHVFRLDEDALVQRSLDGQKLILSCSVLGSKISDNNKNNVMQIDCLNQLYPELIIYLVAHLSELIIYTEPESCMNCMNFDLSNLLSQVAGYGSWTEKITHIDNTEGLQNYMTEEKLLTKDKPIGRREFLKMLLNGGRKASVEILAETAANHNIRLDENNDATDIINGVLPEKRKRLFAAFKKLGEKEEIDQSKILPYKHLQVGECSFCAICTRLCPANALEIMEFENEKYLSYSLQDCTGCGLCQDVCLFGKISWGACVTVEDFLQNQNINLASAEAKECQSCSSIYYQYPDGGELCLLCRNKKNLSKSFVSPYAKKLKHIENNVFVSKESSKVVRHLLT